MHRSLPILAAFVVVVGTGVVHGLWVDRWGTPAELAAAAGRLQNIPRDVGDWHGTDLELDERQVKGARLAGYCYRRYENARNRRAVLVMVLCGRPGPISVHTPDICFRGAGYKVVASPSDFAMAYGSAGKSAAFQTARMRKEAAAAPTDLRVFWSWNAGGAWEAPENPRVVFARHDALYKLYVARESVPGESTLSPEDDPSTQLIRELLPAIDAALSP